MMNLNVKKCKKNELLKKIKRFQVLELIYDSNKRRKTKIVETILANLNPKVIERLMERVKQKSEVLRQLKKELLATTWKTNLINNYYKSLDVRSGSLQQNEKYFMSPKYFISNLIETERKIMEKEKQRYWMRVIWPETSLSRKTALQTFEDMQNSEVINNSAIFGGEEGMYDSLIKISSHVKRTEEEADPFANESGLVRSEYKLGAETEDSSKGSQVH